MINMLDSLVKRKKMTDFIKQIQFSAKMLCCVFVNKSVCYFDVSEKGEVIQLLRVLGDDRFVTQPFMIGGDVSFCVLQEKGSNLALVCERPYIKSEKGNPTFKNLASTVITKFAFDSEYHVNARIWKNNSIVSVVSIKKESKNNPQQAFIIIFQ